MEKIEYFVYYPEETSYGEVEHSSELRTFDTLEQAQEFVKNYKSSWDKESRSDYCTIIKGIVVK